MNEKMVADFYNARYARSGRSVKTVGWSTMETQSLRFAELFRFISVEDPVVVDVGCGLGDLVPWMNDNLPGRFTYVGIDIAADLIDDASRRFSGHENIEFIVGDVANIPIPACDVAVASGAFSLRGAWDVAKMRGTVHAMFDAARVAVACNFLSSDVDYTEERNVHYSPTDILGVAEAKTRSWHLWSGYGLYEVTLLMRKGEV